MRARTLAKPGASAGLAAASRDMRATGLIVTVDRDGQEVGDPCCTARDAGGVELCTRHRLRNFCWASSQDGHASACRGRGRAHRAPGRNRRGAHQRAVAVGARADLVSSASPTFLPTTQPCKSGTPCITRCARSFLPRGSRTRWREASWARRNSQKAWFSS